MTPSNIIAFLLFAVYTFKLGKFFNDVFTRWGFYLSMLFSLNIIVFFGVARGYGLAFAFFIMGLYYLVAILKTPSIKHLFLTMIGLNLALFSNFTLL